MVPWVTSRKVVLERTSYDFGSTPKTYTLRGEASLDEQVRFTFTVDEKNMGRIILVVFEQECTHPGMKGGTGIQLARFNSTFFARMLRGSGRLDNGSLAHWGSIDEDKSMLDIEKPPEQVFARAVQQKIDVAKKLLREGITGRSRHEIAIELEALRRIQEVFPFTPLQLA